MENTNQTKSKDDIIMDAKRRYNEDTEKYKDLRSKILKTVMESWKKWGLTSNITRDTIQIWKDLSNAMANARSLLQPLYCYSAAMKTSELSKTVEEILVDLEKALNGGEKRLNRIQYALINNENHSYQVKKETASEQDSPLDITLEVAGETSQEDARSKVQSFMETRQEDVNHDYYVTLHNNPIPSDVTRKEELELRPLLRYEDEFWKYIDDYVDRALDHRVKDDKVRPVVKRAPYPASAVNVNDLCKAIPITDEKGIICNLMVVLPIVYDADFYFVAAEVYEQAHRIYQHLGKPLDSLSQGEETVTLAKK